MLQYLLILSNHCWLRRLLSSNGPIGGRCSLVWPSVASSASLALQTTINKGIRLFTGARLSTAIGPLLHRIQSGLVPAIQKSRLRLLGRALDPGVENVYTWLRGEVLNGEADLDQLLVGRNCGACNPWERGMIIGRWQQRLVDFLQVAYRQYQSTLWKYHRDRLVEVG
ncbi:hypothetical protein BASA61_008893 [Batrachochytrium salamandrivorans]|nr:hypothetical protein BASA61_008893 [Batrachochytrium salamandrivorans]KAH9264919.1 hypothetical protein BASA83_011587 [Batrachochytrium salamandrivorans]